MKHPVRVVRGILAAACGIAAAVVWISARDPGDDDRSQIIVRSGSLIFENGTAAAPGTPWSKDAILGEYKPEDPKSGPEYKGVKAFAVTFVNPYTPLSPACANPSLTGKQVQIEYTRSDGSTVQTKIRLRNFFLFGRSEPKVDPEGATLTVTQGATPPQLVLADTGGYISRVSVDKVDCSFSPTTDPVAQHAFWVQIQPKADR